MLRCEIVVSSAHPTMLIRIVSMTLLRSPSIATACGVDEVWNRPITLQFSICMSLTKPETSPFATYPAAASLQVKATMSSPMVPEMLRKVPRQLIPFMCTPSDAMRG